MKKVNLAYNSYSLTSLFLSKLLPLAASSPPGAPGVEAAKPGNVIYSSPVSKTPHITTLENKISVCHVAECRKGEEKKETRSRLLSAGCSAASPGDDKIYSSRSSVCVCVGGSGEEVIIKSVKSTTQSFTRTRTRTHTHTKQPLCAHLCIFKGKTVCFDVVVMFCYCVREVLSFEAVLKFKEN